MQGIEVAVGGKVAHCAAVAAATAALGFGDKLHGANFRRAAQGAHIHTGAIGMQGIEIATQLADDAGDQNALRR